MVVQKISEETLLQVDYRFLDVTRELPSHGLWIVGASLLQ